ncbi:MAG: hypothetical protein QNJ88_12180 [Acidimicrobiia bacterium]|nr:hypothetical protein [Acidimicrobiia bacterium]
MDVLGGWWSRAGSFMRAATNVIVIVAVLVALIALTQARGRLLLIQPGCSYIVNEAGEPEQTTFCSL